MFNKSSHPEHAAQDTAQETPVMVEDRVEGQSERPEPGAPEFSGAEVSPGAGPEAAADSSTEEAWQGRYQLLQDQFARLAADFDNYRKRVREEQEQLARYGAQKAVTDLLPVLDNLERANGSLNENSDPKLLYKSFALMQKQLQDGLEGLGVQKIPAVGQPFDPQVHEAVSRMESAEFPENTIMYEAQGGYSLNGKVIRPAQVVVSMGAGDASPAAEPAAPSDEAEKSGNPFRS